MKTCFNRTAFSAVRLKTDVRFNPATARNLLKQLKILKRPPALRVAFFVFAKLVSVTF